MTSVPPSLLKKFPLVSGQYGGIPVRCDTPQAQGVYENLKLLADDKKNYWAQIIINGIQGLSSGVLHQNNIFIKRNTDVRISAARNKLNNTFQGEFVMMLPGCEVTFEKYGSGEIRIIFMSPDPEENYIKLQRQGKRPGLYTVRHGLDEESWVPKFIADGQIRDQQDLSVAITDRHSSGVRDAANIVAPYVKAAPESRDLDKYGFDMHFTPGEPGDGGIGGLRKLREAWFPGGNVRVRESAILLAKTMYQAKNVDNVKWISERGGSKILIEAMKILANQNIKLNKHSIYFSNPTTNVFSAIKLRKQLGLKNKGEIKESGSINLSEITGSFSWGSGIIVSFQRKKYEKDFNNWKLAGSIGREVAKLKGLGVVTASTIGLVALGYSTKFGSVPAATAFLWAFAKEGVDAASEIAKGMAPNLVNKIKGKLE